MPDRSLLAPQAIALAGCAALLSLCPRQAIALWPDDPATNVVDRFGFCHEVPNLGVLGASVMGTSSARNPTLTAQALAWRTAEHLAASWRTISGE